MSPRLSFFSTLALLPMGKSVYLPGKGQNLFHVRVAPPFRDTRFAFWREAWRAASPPKSSMFPLAAAAKPPQPVGKGRSWGGDASPNRSTGDLVSRRASASTKHRHTLRRVH